MFLLVTAAGWLVDQSGQDGVLVLPAGLVALFGVGHRRVLDRATVSLLVVGGGAIGRARGAGRRICIVDRPADVGPQVSVETVWGPQTPQDSAEFILFFLIIGVAMLGIMYTAVAAAGVWWGRRRREPDPAPHRVDGH